MEFYGLVGEKLSHSLSPKIHQIIFSLLGTEAAYKLFEVPADKLEELTQALKLLNIRGVNVTIPYKQSLMQLVDQVSEEAQAIGALNTLVLSEGKLIGYNTDYFGFSELLKENEIIIADQLIVILGTGGAAQAVRAVLLDQDIKKIYMVTRDKNKQNKQPMDHRIEIIDYQELNNIQGDILINATPIGMYPNIKLSPVTNSVIEKFNILIDTIYNPNQTEFLRLGKKSSKKIVSGLYMLVAQAIKAQELWQGQAMDELISQYIYKILLEELVHGH